MPQDSSFNQLKQPSPYAIALLNALTSEQDFKRYPRGSRFVFVQGGEHQCLFFRTGVVSIENIENSLLLGIASAPVSLGFTSALSDKLLIRALEECEAATIPLDDVMETIERKHLWEIMAKHMIIVTNKLFIQNEMATAPTAYDLLCYQLQALSQEPESIRSQMAAYQYILERTRLSRSSVMKMLSALKKGGYIELEQGKLIAIHHLPSRF
ncbi:helix-turn-helix domain-containing protein [Citrobacter sp. CK198]|uniref:winged helix-turn-helix transcriptional regulator n=1 Tax=Citrobacter sp. CK198 TaxID=2985107 RepID=UPI00257868F7|nr:winged helix-turn-helix transcriptional regulator [Citrobacter sp. CK198]MDM2973212.1 helix-turn-helix domain-containing protein [Citrobacter sp. CK198]